MAPLPWHPQYNAEKGEASKNGVHYEAAGGNRIQNEGEERTKTRSNAGGVMQTTFPVAIVTRPLRLVSKICEKDHEIVFGESGSLGKRLA